MTRTVIVPEVDALALALGIAQREHEKAHHKVKDPVTVPYECLRDVAERVLVEVIRDEIGRSGQ